MLLSEFIDRTGYRPTEDEYTRIESEYYEFDGNKDEFCRAWKRANPASVRKAKERKAHQVKMSKVFTLICRLDRWHKSMNYFSTPAYKVLKKSDYELLDDVLFLNTRRAQTDMFYSVGDLHLDLQRFYKNSTERV